ncbi:MAG: hypothetical protein FJW83_07500 [Actinobacteria bacterium]|nr:hypothetical protein [Actinomycetota bacterium]
MRRLTWMTVGAVLGGVGSRWARRRATRLIRRGGPLEGARRAGGAVRGRVQDAIGEGRRAAAETERRLRDEHDRPAPPA